MTPFEALTTNEKELIEAYIKDNVPSNEGYAPVEHILRFWNTEKEKLFNIFGEKLITSFPVEYKMSVDQLYSIMENEGLYTIGNVYDKLMKIYSYYSEEHSNLMAMLNRYNLAKNSCDRYWSYTDHWPRNTKYVAFPLADGKIYKCFPGTKPMKLVRKLCESYGIPMEEFQAFCNLHSVCLNQKKLKGELCLSIHPLDYMTMSDNNSSWHTCMSWQENGEYKQGTVEMMNSNCVVVAYLKSDYPWRCSYHCDHTWNDKKWRCLMVVDDNFIISVKNYPYNQEHLVQQAVKHLTKMVGWKDTEVFNYNVGDTIKRDNGTKFEVNFDTGCMYNDFGHEFHYMAINPDLDVNYDDHYYCYSGVSECMACGTTNYDVIGYDYDSAALACDNCSPHMRCSHCGDIIRGEEFWINDEMVCECCYDNHYPYE